MGDPPAPLGATERRAGDAQERPLGDWPGHSSGPRPAERTSLELERAPRIGSQRAAASRDLQRTSDNAGDDLTRQDMAKAERFES